MAVFAHNVDDGASDDLRWMWGAVILDETGFKIRSWGELWYLYKQEQTLREVHEA